LKNEPTANRQPPTANRQPPTVNRQLPTANRQLETLNHIAAENNHTGIQIKEIEPSIEDSFILLMSQQNTITAPQKNAEK
jgi:hypothetical protein